MGFNTKTQYPEELGSGAKVFSEYKGKEEGEGEGEVEGEGCT